MSNIVKYNLSTSPNSIQSGNFNVGVNNTSTDLSGFYNGISPIIGGYTIYINKASNGPSIYAPKNDTELIQITNSLGASVATAAEALVWINSQSTMTVLNNNYPSIVTSGLVMNLDAGFVSSYPRGGTGWKDLSGNGNTGTLVNGPIYDSSYGGSIVFDGVDDYCDSTINNRSTTVNTVEMYVKWISGSNGMFVGFTSYDIWTYGGRLGFNTAASDVYGISSARVTELNLVGASNENWHHYVFVFSNQVQNNKIYIDGNEEVLSQQIGVTNLTANRAFQTSIRFPSWLNSTGYLIKANYSYVRVYNRELSVGEVLQNYYAGLQRFIPTDGLVLSLDAQNTNLYATSPTTAYDVSGNDNNGSMNNGVQYVGDGDGSWKFDGIDDYIALPGIQYPEFTITAWINLNELNKFHGIMGRASSIWSNLSYAFRIVNSNRLNIALSNSGTHTGTPGTYQEVTSPTTLSKGVWYNVSVTFSRPNVKLYLNGASSGTGTFDYELYNSSSDSIIGGYTYGAGLSYLMNGNISDVNMYNRALTAAEISIIYNATKSRYGL